MDATSRSVTESFLGVVGGAGAVGSVLGLLASVTDEYIKSLKGSIQAGFSFSDQIIQTNHELASIGINFHQFGQILVEQGEAIRFLGSNSHEASSRFVDLVKTVRMSTKDMGYFGLSSREMADELADTMGVLITAGVSEADIMSRTHETFTYLNQEVLAYARLTGRNRRDIMRSKQELVDDNVLFKEVLKKLGPEAMQTFDMVGASMSAFGKQSVFAGDVLQKFITQIVDGARVDPELISSLGIAGLDEIFTNMAQFYVDHHDKPDMIREAMLEFNTDISDAISEHSGELGKQANIYKSTDHWLAPFLTNILHMGQESEVFRQSIKGLNREQTLAKMYGEIDETTQRMLDAARKLDEFSATFKAAMLKVIDGDTIEMFAVALGNTVGQITKFLGKIIEFKIIIDRFFEDNFGVDSSLITALVAGIGTLFAAKAVVAAMTAGVASLFGGRMIGGGGPGGPRGTPPRTRRVRGRGLVRALGLLANAAIGVSTVLGGTGLFGGGAEAEEPRRAQLSDEAKAKAAAADKDLRLREEALDAQRQKVQQMTDDIRDAKVKASISAAELQNMEDVKEAQRQKVQQMTEEMRNAKARANASADELRNMEEARDTQRQKVQQMTEEIRVAKKQAKVSADELQDKEKAREAQRQKAQQMTDDIIEARAQARISADELQNMEDAKETQRQKVQQMTDDIRTAKTQAKVSSDELNAKEKARNIELEKVQQMTDDIRIARTRADISADELRNMEEAREAQRKKVQNLVEETRDIKATAKASVDELNAKEKIRDVELEKVQQMTEEMRNAKARANASADELRNMEEARETQRQKVQELVEETRNIKAKAQVSSDELRNMEEARETQRQKVQQMTEEMRNAKARANASADELRNMEEARETQRQKVQQMTEEIRIARAKANVSANELRSMEKGRAAGIEKTQRMTAELTEMKYKAKISQVMLSGTETLQELELEKAQIMMEELRVARAKANVSANELRTLEEAEEAQRQKVQQLNEQIRKNKEANRMREDAIDEERRIRKVSTDAQSKALAASADDIAKTAGTASKVLKGATKVLAVAAPAMVIADGTMGLADQDLKKRGYSAPDRIMQGLTTGTLAGIDLGLNVLPFASNKLLGTDHGYSNFAGRWDNFYREGIDEGGTASLVPKVVEHLSRNDLYENNTHGGARRFPNRRPSANPITVANPTMPTISRQDNSFERFEQMPQIMDTLNEKMEEQTGWFKKLFGLGEESNRIQRRSLEELASP